MNANTIQIFIMLLVFSSSCKPIKEVGSYKTDSAINHIGISTAYKFPPLEIPKGMYLDSIAVYDSLSRAGYIAYYLQSKEIENVGFNQVILQEVKNQIIHEQQFVEPYEEDLPDEIIYSYILRPTEIYSNGQIISISNIIDTYYKGGNHHNYTRHTFNYDLKKHKPIRFNDVFRLQSKTDSAEFITFAEQFTLDGCTDWDLPYEYLDFSFANSGIYINPNLSWACISTRSLLPYETKNKFINKEWIKQNQLPTKK
ncbi:MAG: hypothetical protein IPO21_03190 [Bacteroidales bacterium]|nr:hypothetical protein [Bacteroidales bacterium]